MHWTATQPGLLDAERELVLIEQTPSEVVFLSAADTDLACVASTWRNVFGKRLRIAHAAPLRQPVSADDYVDRVIKNAKLVIIRLLGGPSYFPHFFQALSDLRDDNSRPRILMIPATDVYESELEAWSDFPSEVCRSFFQYFKEGGRVNYENAGRSVQMLLEGHANSLPEAVPTPDFGSYYTSSRQTNRTVWICFYKAWQQTGDLDVVDALIELLEKSCFSVKAFYAYSLRKTDAQMELLKEAENCCPDTILWLQSFSILSQHREEISVFEKLGCPVLQLSVSSFSRESWLKNPGGMSPTEVAMNVALPEIDGRVFGTVLGFKENEQTSTELEFTTKRLKADPNQIRFVVQLVETWIRLRSLKNSEKKIAIVLSNYPNKDGRIGNGVGLDTPASTIKFLHALRKAGYLIDRMPEDAEQLMAWLQSGVTNDPEQSYGKSSPLTISHERFETYLSNLPEKNQKAIGEQWTQSQQYQINIPGIQLGNVFIGIQPPRGFSLQTQAIYHSPDLVPPPEYLAFYLWIRESFQANAIVHFGKHGNLEWLPGRSVGLGCDDYPQICLGPLPHFYPFIVNNPGEGSQAKRRTSAVIIDHLTPPLTRAGLYDDLEKIERLLEERSHFLDLYPQRAEELEKEIQEVISGTSWARDLPENQNSIEAVSNFLCEIKESQIRSALHILGETPSGEKKIDFLLSVLRMPAANRPGLLEALDPDAKDLEKLSASRRDKLDLVARQWIADAMVHRQRGDESESLTMLRELLHVQLLPRLHGCSQEIENLLRGLDGKYIPSGAAGSPTRGRLDVLPTGRNFFSIDPRVIPTPTAWKCGQTMANLLLERHYQEKGRYPKTIALVVWGTSNMRTGGDDIAQALWLWGCEPVWEPESGRVLDFRIIPANILGRPRVDVVLRVSGLFRDAFGDTMRLLATVPKRLAELDEPVEINPIREAWLRDRDALVAKGMDQSHASRMAQLRVFSSGPGCYGTGLLPLIDAGNWDSAEDIMNVFCKWGGFAYDSEGKGSEQIQLLKDRLKEVEVVHQNQDNREHDILDSDDYFQFQGGLHATIEQLRGEAPATYHGDSSRPEQPKVRALSEELIRVIRSRVLNPRWIASMREHGYKGAFEMSATVDYLFGYDATCGVVGDHHYDEVAQKLLLDPIQKEFFKRHNPVALQESVRRLLEARERNLWKNPNHQTIDALEELLIDIQGQLE